LPLEHLTALGEFIITDIIFGFQKLKWVTELLQKMRVNSSVETVRFRMWHLNVSCANNFDWDTIKAILIVMPRLSVVAFELWGAGSVLEMRSIVQQKLGGLEKKYDLKLSGRVD
jgi:hypothetical protein